MSRITMKELMVTPIISVDPKTPTDKITVMMSKHGLRSIPVIENGKLVGVITSRDIIRIFKDYMTSSIRQGKRISRSLISLLSRLIS